jgi:MYXO-CTERM domain-containing protein
VCAAPDACNDGVCDPVTGACVSSPRPDGALCDDHDACTVGETCHSGACTGGSAMVCQAQDACHVAGTCDPRAGCENPVLTTCGGTGTPSGSPGSTPSGEICATDQECQSEHCSRGVCCDSACTDQCHSCALPGSRGVCTVEPEGTDLYQQCGFVGTCERTCGPDGTCVGASAGTTCVPQRCVDQHHTAGAILCEALAGGGFECPGPSGPPLDCAPYACLAPFGTCASTCRTVADCAPGYACAGDHHCQFVPSPTGGSDGGCQHPSGSPSGPGALSLLLLLALRRRHAGLSGQRRWMKS